MRSSLESANQVESGFDGRLRLYTAKALENLDQILEFIASNYPIVYEPFEQRLQSVVVRISEWPESAQEVAERLGI